MSQIAMCLYCYS